MIAIRVRPMLARVTLAGLFTGLFALPVAFPQAASARTAVTCPTVGAGGQVDPAPQNGVNWSGCDLTGANLAGAPLQNANFSNANLTNANLAGAALGSATLTSANLTGATVTSAETFDIDLTDATLTNADFSGSNLASDALTGANLVGADLGNTDLVAVTSGSVTGTPAVLPAKFEIVAGFLIGPNVSLSSADLTGADLSNLDLFGVDLRNATLTGANLTDADLTESRISDAAIGMANLTGANLTEIQSGGVTGAGASLPVNWQLVEGYLIGPTALVWNAFLPGVSLAGADVAGTDFKGSNLAGADFAGADLTGAKLDATLTNADFTGATLTNAALDGGNLTGAQLPGDDLSTATVTGANLTNVDLADADLESVSFDDDLGHGLSLTGADLENANLTDADLGHVDASNADFKNANLSGANLFELVVSGANLAGTTLTGVSSPVAGTPSALPGGWQLIRVAPSFEADSAYLAGPGADLEGARLHGVEASRVDLTGADLRGADLAATDLSHANLSSADLGGAVFTNRLSKKHTNLTDANLAHATLLRSDLSPANAELTGVTWLDTICPDGSNSDQFTGGCFGKPRHNPLVVTVQGVKSGGTYVIGGFKISCRTTDALEPVTVPAKLKITRRGAHGVGETTATCAGAVDAAGDKSKPVSVSYAVVYGFGGFTAPKPGVAVSLKTHHFTATFRLATGSGSAIASSVGADLAKAGKIEVMLTGPGIHATTTRCSWKTATHKFNCVVKIPAGIKSGKSGYRLTALENPGLPRFITAPGILGATNPQPVKFK